MQSIARTGMRSIPLGFSLFAVAFGALSLGCGDSDGGGAAGAHQSISQADKDANASMEAHMKLPKKKGK